MLGDGFHNHRTNTIFIYFVTFEIQALCMQNCTMVLLYGFLLAVMVLEVTFTLHNVKPPSVP